MRSILMGEETTTTMTIEPNEGTGQALVYETNTRRMVCKLISYLLQYPDTAWREGLQGVKEAIHSISDETVNQILLTFVDEAQAVSSIEWQDAYVRTFDFDKKCNLYLTYALHGDERDRGPALIELKRRYEAAGFYMEVSELPDYLPMVLEFVAEAPEEDVLGVLSSCHKALVTMTESITGQNSPYGPMLSLMLQVIPEPPAPDVPKQEEAVNQQPEDLMQIAAQMRRGNR
ncbi:nitrate reductase molybdenum cofactor assembly chaperone [Paenibacillus amylolyticus]|uniref:Nitrate reductase molybdenum cofactor assembly chaperone n=1 Tax=Paenibacillus amylolyticus TaxID=1451 RepID=A0A100VMQ9_PAEAM|nr:nitrate reductase molybdenum cofactor assembly chaperone [Paenibacillus amylolyticus]GAS82566.1 nitrate reductase molybdenum cofactor assembly chaperone [Paenibacillus amylolyticus]